MASAVAVTTVPVTSVRRQATIDGSDAFFCPMNFRVAAPTTRMYSTTAGRFSVQASSSMNEKAIGGLTAAALVVPEVAEAAQPGVSPSLKSFLLSIAAGGVVLGVITGAVTGVANFDPVKRS